jgi:hypothetical protein
MRMRSLIVVVIGLVIFGFCVVAHAQTWVTANQVTVAWDAVTQTVEGLAIPASEMKYQVYIRTGTTGDGTAVDGIISETQLAITFTAEGRYYIGVRAIRYPAGEASGYGSYVSWSNDPLVCAVAGPFGVVYYAVPINPKGLRIAP